MSGNGIGIGAGKNQPGLGYRSKPDRTDMVRIGKRGHTSGYRIASRAAPIMTVQTLQVMSGRFVNKPCRFRQGRRADKPNGYGLFRPRRQAKASCRFCPGQTRAMPWLTGKGRTRQQASIQRQSPWLLDIWMAGINAGNTGQCQYPANPASRHRKSSRATIYRRRE